MSDIHDDFTRADNIVEHDYDMVKRRIQLLKYERHSSATKHAVSIFIIVIIIFFAWACEAVVLNMYQNERLENIKEELIGNAYSCHETKYRHDYGIIQTGDYYVYYELCFLKNGTVEYYRAVTSSRRETPSWSYVGTYDYSLSMSLLGKCKINIPDASLTFKIKLSSDGSPNGLSIVS